MSTKKIESGRSVSMKQLAANSDPRLEQILEVYYPELEKAFPLEGEIETPETYLGYLRDTSFPWDMVVLYDEDGTIAGGIQYQVLTVNGKTVNKAAWCEHIWVKESNRSFENFIKLLRVAQERILAAGANMVFMEFNNVSKMTAEEIEEDARGGITTQDRTTIWGRVGINVATYSNGTIAHYAQPSMDGQPPVEYLSFGFIRVDGEDLTGSTMPVDDYLAIAHAAHATISGVDLEKDQTVVAYTTALRTSGEEYLTFVPLAEVAECQREDR